MPNPFIPIPYPCIHHPPPTTHRLCASNGSNQGYKSFAHRTELLFEDGVTAVVGPNGSGKSNIADALRWVLGETNVRHLRGKKSEDLIFAGSDGRGQVGMAQVSLTLDNSGGWYRPLRPGAKADDRGEIGESNPAGERPVKLTDALLAHAGRSDHHPPRLP
ncbi:MAG: AAA family ATPase [Anaerolineae bacterium]|nr:AAA family ATPase [Anaerolineae bacterium]